MRVPSVGLERCYISASANPGARGFMLDHLDPAVRTLREVFVGMGAASRTLEQMIPFLGIGRESQVLEVMRRLSAPEIEKGISKGAELLLIYSKFVKTCADPFQGKG